MKNIFKIGDIIDSPESTWGSQRFVIEKFFGGQGWQMVYTHKLGESMKCNFVLSYIRLVDAPKRPFRTIPMNKLIKLVTRGILDAQRELKIRNNIRKIKNGR